MTKKRIKFQELGASRVNKAIKLIRLISNLSNKSHYQYDKKDADKIINALNQEIKILKEKFNSGKQTTNEDFKF